MTNMTVKEVDFNGATLMAVQSNDDGKIYVGVKWICNGIGLTEDQTKRQYKNIREDLVLSKGVSNLTLPTNGGLQEIITLDIDFLPLWLAKISITPTMQTNNPEVVKKLVEYQLKAKDVLAQAFIHNPIQEYLNWDEDERAIAFFNERKQNKVLQQQLQIAEPKARKYEEFLEADGYMSMNNVAKLLKIGRNTLFEFLRWGKLLMRNNTPYERFMKGKDYFKVIEKVARNGKVNPVTTVSPRGMDLISDLVKEKYQAFVEYKDAGKSA